MPTNLVVVVLVMPNWLIPQVPVTDDLYQYAGCFEDARSRVMSRQIALQTNEPTLAKCANACPADTGHTWKYASLGFGQEW